MCVGEHIQYLKLRRWCPEPAGGEKAIRAAVAVKLELPAARVTPVCLLVWNQRDGFGSTFVAVFVGYA